MCVLQAFTPGIVSLEMEAVLLCQDRDVQNHLKTFYDNLDTSPMHLTYTTGEYRHGDGGVWSEELGEGWHLYVSSSLTPLLLCPSHV